MKVATLINKEKERLYCIYRITNLINGKTYIGQHKYEELNDDYMGSGKHLISAQKKYGIENFKKDILVFNVAKKEHIDLLEKTFIASEREKAGTGNCYNIADGGGGGNGGYNKGKHFSEEARKNMSEAHKGKPAHNKGKKMSEEQKKKLSEAQKGKHSKPHSEETKRKLSKAHKGKKLSEEHRKKLSEVGKGNTNALGKKRTEEQKKKLSEIYRGKHWKVVDGKRVWY